MILMNRDWEAIIDRRERDGVTINDIPEIKLKMALKSSNDAVANAAHRELAFREKYRKTVS